MSRAATSPAQNLANLWIGRKRHDPKQVAEARDRVADLKPVVLVTGGSRGIGAALAGRFAKAGHDVVIAARNRADLAETASRIARDTGRMCSTISQDIRDPGAPASIAGKLQADGQYIEFLVNNAGMGLSGKFESHQPDDIDNLVASNITALTGLMRFVLPDLLARRRGGILNVASLGGTVPGPYQAAYYASKAYVISLTEAVAAENSGLGVRIAVLAPGPVDTAFHAGMGAEASLYRRLLPALSPEQTANAAYSGFMRGQRLIVPGLFNRVSYVFLRLAPHPISVPLMAWLLGKR